jgi:hypothetical protein
LATEPADLVHVEAVAFNSRTAYEAWGQTRGYKVKESLIVEDQLSATASNAGFTDASTVPQWYTDYANNVVNQQMDYPSPCYLGVTLWDSPSPQLIDPLFFTPSTIPFQSLPLFFHVASSAKFHRLTTCGATTGHMRAYKKLHPITVWPFNNNKIMTISVVAGTPRFPFANIFSPLNNNIGCFFHWGTF